MTEIELLNKIDNIRNNIVNPIRLIEHQHILTGSTTLFTIKNLTVYRCYTSTRILEDIKNVMSNFK